MATVYRATDVKHGRDVAIKVMPPELAESIQSKRFLQEIRIAAGLQHPRILGVYDSGEADDLLYYVMPLVEGETLRGLLTREVQLPVDQAIRIARDVATALAYAHSRGIVHRDIKPENIMLSAGEVVVADFGIALALSNASDTRLTRTGGSVGTPAYMSPEQAGGDSRIDARSDIYSLGCVLYEMLAGSPPFTGRTMESVVRQHVAAPIPDVSVIRPLVPAALSDLIGRALAKVPADRVQSASAFLAGLDATATSPTLERPPTVTSQPKAVRIAVPRVSRRAMIVAAAVALLALAGVAAVWLLGTASRPDPDPALISVFPFKVSGDSSAEFLREGMVDLLTTQLGSISGARTLDARTILSAWRRNVPEGEDPSPNEARQLAASLGSGRFVLGDIVSTATGLSVAARLVDVEGGGAFSGSVQGSRDSLFKLVDDLTSQLIAKTVGEPARRLSDLTRPSLPVVRAYLDGRAALRRGAIVRARERFTEALELDSTFALAALGMASAGVWSQQAGQSAALRRGLLTGYALRHRLSQRDQLLFEAWVLPDTGSTHTARDQLVGWQRAAEAAPESPEALYEYADRLYHSGEQLGVASARAQADSLFSRALALDSTFAPPLAHLVELALRDGDRRRVRRLAALYGVESSTADAGDYVRWRVAVVTGDRRAREVLRSRLTGMQQASINRIIGFGLTDGVGYDDIDAAAAELRRRVDARTDTPNNVPPGQSLHTWALNRGRSAEVARAIATMRADERPAGSSIVFFTADEVPVLDALFWDGDSTAAAEAAERMEQRVTSPAPGESALRARYNTELCVVALWRRAVGDSNMAATMIDRLRRTASGNDVASVHGASPVLCLAVLDAMAATGRTDAAIARLDSIMTSGPYVFGSDWGNLALARRYAAVGDTASALRVVRRRPYDWDSGPLYLSSYLRAEGRYASATGDRDGAARAYDQYLALRLGADPRFQSHTDEVRRARAALR